MKSRRHLYHDRTISLSIIAERPSFDLSVDTEQLRFEFPGNTIERSSHNVPVNPRLNLFMGIINQPHLDLPLDTLEQQLSGDMEQPCHGPADTCEQLVEITLS